MSIGASAQISPDNDERVCISYTLTSGVNFVIQNEDGTQALEGPAYYLFFAGVMVGSAFVFIFAALCATTVTSPR